MSRRVSDSLVKDSATTNLPAEGPLRIEFPSGWGSGPIFDWQKAQHSRLFVRLQLRKEHQKPYHHQFVVLTLDNEQFCRLDRKGDDDAPPDDAIAPSGMFAKDTIEMLSPMQIKEILSTSAIVLELEFPQGEDISTILEICYVIQHDQQAKRFTLQRFNCYFFSFTIAMCLARRATAWNTTFSGPHLNVLLNTLRDTPIPRSIQLDTWHGKTQGNIFRESLQVVLFDVRHKLEDTLNKTLLCGAVREAVREAAQGVVENTIRVTAGQAFSNAVCDLFAEVFMKIYINLWTTRTVAPSAAARTFENSALRTYCRATARVAAIMAARTAATDPTWDASVVVARLAAWDAESRTSESGSRSGVPNHLKSAIVQTSLAERDERDVEWDSAWELVWKSEWYLIWRSAWQSEWDSTWRVNPAFGWHIVLANMVSDCMADGVVNRNLNSGMDSLRIFVNDAKVWRHQMQLIRK